MNKTQEHDRIADSKDDKHGSSEYINLGGNNVGASMRVNQRSFKGKPKDCCCCCINIYINSNVEGVSNSVLYGSQVKMRDPGIRLYFEDLKVDGDRSATTANSMSRLGFWLCVVFLFAFLVFLCILLYSSRIFVTVRRQTTPGSVSLDFAA